MATILLALKYNLPLDEVIYCEVMFANSISGEHPEHREFIHSTAIPFLKSVGIKTTIVKSRKTYLDLFCRPVTRGPKKGELRAWPLCGRCYIQRDLKIRPLDKYMQTLEEPLTKYVGIAVDEPRRIARLDGTNKVSLLARYDVTEAAAMALCKEHGLLSPIYEFTSRGGCFFCPNACWPELQHLHDYHHDLWGYLLALQKLPNKTTERFNRVYRFDEIDKIIRRGWW